MISGRISTMEQGLRWDWETFPQWMDSLAKHPLGVNVGALVPFNPLRLYVMGIDESCERVHATEAETRQMQALVHEAMAAGAFGWSSMKTLINRPDDGRFIPSQVASNEEYLAPARVGPPRPPATACVHVPEHRSIPPVAASQNARPSD